MPAVSFMSFVPFMLFMFRLLGKPALHRDRTGSTPGRSRLLRRELPTRHAGVVIDEVPAMRAEDVAGDLGRAIVGGRHDHDEVAKLQLIDMTPGVLGLVA